MDRKLNNPMWCCEQIEEKIKDYKLSLTETDNDEVRTQLEIIIDDLEEILYGQIHIQGNQKLRKFYQKKYLRKCQTKVQHKH